METAASVQDYPNIRRLEDISAGETAWYGLLGKLDITPSNKLNDNQRGTLKEATIKRLQELEPQDYAAFCQHAHKFDVSHSNSHESERMFSDMPKYFDTRMAHRDEGIELNKKRERIIDWTDRVACTAGTIGLVGAAMFVGESTYNEVVEHYIDTPTLIRCLRWTGCALGGLIGGSIGFVGAGIAMDSLEEKARTKVFEFEAKVHQIFQEEVREYIDQNKVYS